jgi:hypothetical protein
MALGARVDPLLSELATCTTQAEGPAIKASTLEVGVRHDSGWLLFTSLLEYFVLIEFSG